MKSQRFGKVRLWLGENEQTVNIGIHFPKVMGEGIHSLYHFLECYLRGKYARKQCEEVTNESQDQERTNGK